MEITPITTKELYKKFWLENNLSFLQSWEWGEVKKFSWKPIRLAYGNIPFTIFLKKFPFINAHFGYMPRPFSKDTLSSALLKKINEYANKVLKISHLIIDPNLIKTKEIEEFSKNGYINSGVTIQPNQTNIIDTSKSENDIWMAMSSNYRKKIRRAAKYGCSVIYLERDKKDAVERFFKFMKDIYKRTNYVMYGINYFQKIWAEFTKENNTRIYLVRYKDQDIGAILYLYDNIGAYELYGGICNSGRKIMANYILKWTAMRDAVKMKKKFYDQWGVSPKIGDNYDKKDKLYNISLFKDGFGGQYTEFMPQQTIIFNQSVHKLYILLKNFNKIFVKYRFF